MKKTIRLWVTTLISVVESAIVLAQPIPIDSMYLGQTPPGKTPVVFNLPVTPGLRPIERLAITTDGKEIYFGELNTYPPSVQKVRCMKYLDNRWQGPLEVFNGYSCPRLTVNDSVIYVEAIINNSLTAYYSRRIPAGWSTPVRVMATTQQTHYFQTTGLGSSYLSSNVPPGSTQNDICRLVMSNGDTLIQSLGSPINTTFDENDLFVADDESYLLFTRTGSPAGDIYVTFKRPDGRWTNPKKFSEPINKPGYSWEYGQFVSKDGKYLFFTSGQLTMSSYFTYWVRIDSTIDSMRHSNFIPYLNYQIPNQSIGQGQLLTYTVPDTTFVDDDGNNTLSYSATLSNGNPLPVWLSFNPATRTFSGTPTATAILSLKVSATDTANAAASCTFVLNVTVTGIEKPEDELPGRVELYQNYPNPFNPTATIGFTIAKSGRYTLKLYDMLGAFVREVSEREYRAGYHNEVIDAEGLSSGIYVCRLTGENADAVRKVILLR